MLLLFFRLSLSFHIPQSNQNLCLIFGVFTQNLQCFHSGFLLSILSQN